MKKNKRNGIKKLWLGWTIKSPYFRPTHARAPADFDNEKRQILKDENFISYQH